MESLRKLIDRWRIEGVVLLPPPTASEVRETFAALGSVATADVLELYSVVGGMDRDGPEDWRVWPLVEIARENAVKSTSGVLFSDYMLSSWCCRLRPNRDDDTSAVLIDRFDDTEPTVIAGSLAEFFDAYLVEPIGLRVLEPTLGRKWE